MPCKILLPVDGSEGSVRAARHVAGIAASVPGLDIHLVNVQAPGDDWMVRRLLKPEELATLERDWGEASLSPARTVLHEAGLCVTEHIIQGEVAPGITALAKDLGCDQIIMGSHGRTALGGLLLGSVAMKVLHLSEIPVTLVK
ncbi:MAG: universal stress protein [Pseudomonadota bacterium]